ncbi:TPA: hypothetical protein HA318_05150 [Candidatus Micrarchaeota archaeon]|nr:hypothetical protein [Candidatus Micrarchaeota archaeon]
MKGYFLSRKPGFVELLHHVSRSDYIEIATARKVFCFHVGLMVGYSPYFLARVLRQVLVDCVGFDLRACAAQPVEGF